MKPLILSCLIAIACLSRADAAEDRLPGVFGEFSKLELLYLGALDCSIRFTRNSPSGQQVLVDNMASSLTPKDVEELYDLASTGIRTIEMKPDSRGLPKLSISLNGPTGVVIVTTSQGVIDKNPALSEFFRRIEKVKEKKK